MTFNPNLQINETIDNNMLCNIFKCSPQGGMRRSHTTNTLVLINNHLKSTYDDIWDGDILYYTGMGQEGDQDINFNQNKTLSEYHYNDIQVFLFEVYNEREYTFKGEVELINKPFQDEQLDQNKEVRNVWIFPIRVKREANAKVFEKLSKYKKTTTDEKLDYIIRKVDKIEEELLKLKKQL